MPTTPDLFLISNVLKHIHELADIVDVVIAAQMVRLVLCDEKQRLRILYSQAVEIHKSAVDGLIHARGRVSVQEYDRRLAVRDEAGRALSSARSALEQHKQEHGC